jgi:hypothetical protein
MPIVVIERRPVSTAACCSVAPTISPPVSMDDWLEVKLNPSIAIPSVAVRVRNRAVRARFRDSTPQSPRFSHRLDRALRAALNLPPTLLPRFTGNPVCVSRAPGVGGRDLSPGPGRDERSSSTSASTFRSRPSRRPGPGHPAALLVGSQPTRGSPTRLSVATPLLEPAVHPESSTLLELTLSWGPLSSSWGLLLLPRGLLLLSRGPLPLSRGLLPLSRGSLPQIARRCPRRHRTR